MAYTHKRVSLNHGNYQKKMDGQGKIKAYREDINTLRLDYWQLIKAFAPIELDTDQWAETCKKLASSIVCSQRNTMTALISSIRWSQNSKLAVN